MALDETNMCIIDPMDVKPHRHTIKDKVVHYLHGNVMYNYDGMSVAFFRTASYIVSMIIEITS